MKKGLLIILSGPSGVGKNCVRQEIMKSGKVNLTYSISMTTREKREKEIDGVDYYFVSDEEFQKNIDNGNFLEWAEFVGHRYGTPKDKVEDLRNHGKNVFLEIEINGARQVMDAVKDDRVISFFLMPPSFAALEKRIRKRKTESEEMIQKRLAKGRSEIEKAVNYDFVIINDRIKRAGDEIVSIIKQFDAQ